MFYVFPLKKKRLVFCRWNPRLDFTGQTNAFGTGLPPWGKNHTKWDAWRKRWPFSSDWPSQNERLDWLDPKNDGLFPEAPSTRYLCFLGLELVNEHSWLENGPLKDVFPIENVESPASYVSLPRGALRERKKSPFFLSRRCSQLPVNGGIWTRIPGNYPFSTALRCFCCHCENNWKHGHV